MQKRSSIHLGRYLVAFVAATYRERLMTPCTSVTVENAMKWEAVEPERGQLDLSDADRIVGFARERRQAHLR